MKTPDCFSFSRTLVLASFALLAACVDVPPPDPLPPAPLITRFAVSQTEVAVGTAVTLSWKVENSSSLKIVDLKAGSLSGVSGDEGTVDVAIGQDTVFVLTVRNERGASDTAAVAVRVGSAARELLFSLLPNTIAAGESATLAWSAPGASAVTLTASPGGPVDIQGQSSVGVLVVSPSSTTTYTLSANGRTATATLTIEPTLLSFSASSLSADAGSTVTLSWASANATHLQLTAPGRGTLLDTMDAARIAAGTFDDVLPTVVDPGQVFAYQLTVSGAGVTLSDSLVVSINGNPAVLTFTAPKYSRDPSVGPFPDGGTPPANIRLAWTTREADAVSIAANGVEFYRAPLGSVAAGTLDVPAPAADTAFVLIARATRGGSASSTANVDVVGLPTVALTATPSSVAAGEPFRLSWVGTDVHNVKIGGPGLPLFTGRDVMTSGMAPDTFALGATTTLRIDADNGVGDTVSATAPVTVTSAYALTSSSTGTLRTGQTVQLSWTGGGNATGFAHKDAVRRTASAEFDDISTTGQALTMVGTTDDSVGTFLPSDFTAPFFDREVGSQVWVSSNGYLSFSPLNRRNYTEVVLPSAKLEPYSIAPNWDDTTLSSLTTSIYWQVKPRTGGQVLIVMWKTNSSATYEVKIHSTGQIDIEYLSGTFSGKGGVQGPRGDWGYPLPGAAGALIGMTFFGPKASPLNVDVRMPAVLRGSIAPNGPSFSVSHDLTNVVAPNELFVSEGLPSPLLAVGAPGVWYELFNNSTRTVDLTGWGFALADGGLSALSGSLDAGATLVAGASTDPSLNDDAGVQLAVTSLGFDAGSTTLAHDGPHAVASWATALPGVAVVNDVGPFLFATDPSSTTPHAQTCRATDSFGFQLPQQLGTPGSAGHCGFPYRLQEIRERYFDISATGTRVAFATTDDDVVTVPLTGAPFPFFGVAQTQVTVATNGYVTFETTTDMTIFDSAAIPNPETTSPNSLIAVFGDDLISGLPNAGVFTQRIGPNQDPTTPAPHWIIQWHHWSHFGTTSTPVIADDLNFQLKLFDDGTAEMHYGNLLADSFEQYASGISAVAWLENPTGDQALVRTNSLSPGISPHSAFRFVPR